MTPPDPALPPAARAIAERIAAQERDLLAKLVRVGRVARRDGPYERRHPGPTAAFVADIERRVRPPVNLAIRPKKKRGRR